MQVKAVWENKKQYLDLLLLADEQESMIDRYLERGTMFALYDDGLRTVCVVTDEGGGVLEVKPGHCAAVSGPGLGPANAGLVGRFLPREIPDNAGGDGG